MGLVGPDFRARDMTAPTNGWEAAYTWSDKIGAEAKANRTLIIDALLQVGFSNCRDEWWHWSYGDNAWSVRTGRDRALFGLIEPPPGFTFIGAPGIATERVGYRPVQGAGKNFARRGWG